MELTAEAKTVGRMLFAEKADVLPENSVVEIERSVEFGKRQAERAFPPTEEPMTPSSEKRRCALSALASPKVNRTSPRMRRYALRGRCISISTDAGVESGGVWA